jgi:hypothetical protein
MRASNQFKTSNRMNKTAKNAKHAKEFAADFCLSWRTGGLAARDLAVQFLRCYSAIIAKSRPDQATSSAGQSSLNLKFGASIMQVVTPAATEKYRCAYSAHEPF